MLPELAMSADELCRFLEKVWPDMGATYTIERLEPGALTIRLETGADHLRPGGTISGPTLFTAGDLAFYLATMALIGPEAQTVTSGASINFLRRPRPGALIAEARVLKLGRALCTGDVLIFSEGLDAPVAHMSVSYAIPRS